MQLRDYIELWQLKLQALEGMREVEEKVANSPLRQLLHDRYYGTVLEIENRLKGKVPEEE